MIDARKGQNCRRYVGVDSAWGGRAPGALAVLEGDDEGRALVLADRPQRLRWPLMVEAVRLLATHEDMVMAIDQPLVVKNAAGMRPVERAVSKALSGSHKLGAYPANLRNVNCFGPEAGIWSLLQMLEENGFRYDPQGACDAAGGRIFFECYPHLTLLGVFDRTRALRYKVQTGDREAWQQLLDYLSGLRDHPQLPLRDDTGFLAGNVAATKANEDLLDAVLCAYTAAYVHRMPPDASAVLGDLATGAIVTPVSTAFRAHLQDRIDTAMFEAVDAGGMPIPYPEPGQADDASSLAEPTASHGSSGSPSIAGPLPAAPDSCGDVGPAVLEPATMRVHDDGNLWQRLEGRVVNDWFTRFEDVYLDVVLIDLDGEPLSPSSPSARRATCSVG